MIWRWQTHGDTRARDEVVQRFLPLARRLARRYANPNEPLEDLVQVATVGLMAALGRFDVNREVEFGSFAVPTILGELRRHFRDTGWGAHVPRTMQESALRVERASQTIARSGRTPSCHAIAEYLEISLEDVLAGLEAASAHFAWSLDAHAGDDDEDVSALVEMIGHEDPGYATTETILSLAAARRRVPYMERRALDLRYQGFRQSDIAEIMRCSQMQISRLLRRAATRLRAHMDPEVTVDS